MNKIFSIVVLLLCIGAIWYFLQTNNGEGEGKREGKDKPDQSMVLESQQAAASQVSIEPLASLSVAEEAEEEQSSAIPEGGVSTTEEVQAALIVATRNRERAEDALRIIEMKVGALEAQLDDIELAGEDPADAQDQTLGTFQSIFAEYQDAIMAYDEAAAEEEWLQSRVEDAAEE